MRKNASSKGLKTLAETTEQALGASGYETEALYSVAVKIGFMPSTSNDEIEAWIIQTLRLLNGLIRYVERASFSRLVSSFNSGDEFGTSIVKKFARSDTFIVLDHIRSLTSYIQRKFPSSVFESFNFHLPEKSARCGIILVRVKNAAVNKSPVFLPGNIDAIF